VRRRYPAAAAVLALAGLMLMAGPAAAQSPDRPGLLPELDLDLESFTGVLLPGGDFALRARVHNRADEPAEGLRLLGSLHRRQTDRLDFQRAVDDGRFGNLWESFSADVPTIPARSSRAIELSRTAAELGFALPADKYGVYPMRLRLEQGGEPVDEVRTSLVLSPAEVEEPLIAALVVPVDAPPSRRADGTYQPARLLREIAAGGRLSTLVGNAAGAQPVPVTVATSGLLLEELADVAGGYAVRESDELVEHGADAPGARQSARFVARLSALLEQPTAEHLALPFGPADLVALVRHEMPGEAVRLISEGQATSERHTGVRPVPGVLWPPDGLSPAALTEALGARTNTVLLSERYLESGVPTFSPSPLRRLRTPAGPPVQALVPDPWLEDVLNRDLAEQGRAVAAQRLLAETAALYFERPNAPDRGLLLAPPLLWDPPRGLLRDLLDGLAQAPWLEPVTLTDLARAVERETSPVTLTYPTSARSRELGASYVTALRQARLALGSLAGVLDPEDDTPAQFDRLLLAAASVHYRGPAAGQGRELIQVVDGTVGDLYDAVSVMEGPVVTLAGAEGRLPVTLASDADIPVRVQVRFIGPRYDFEPPVLRDVVLEPGEVRTVAVDATPLSPGGIAGIRVVVEDADGLLQLAEGTIVVRSTGLNVVALVITGGAGLFLLAWWGREVRRRRDVASPDTERAAA
jgi:hypothetical protein